ncbi:MAG: PKD domain-containing protein, partial [Gammaproteobacteria bacterium]|nr:PKD domain-containing protein [Gammaproteobacteria bacterium]
MRVFIIVFSTSFLFSLSQSLYASGLVNSGFESGLSAWDVTQSDSVIVTSQDGPADSSTYDDMNITVLPYKNQHMLRLGSPKAVSEKQPSGLNSVAQHFYSVRDHILLSFRLFSWEHRGYDHFTIKLTGPSVESATISDEQGNPLVFTMPDGQVMTCSQLPCDIVIDVGKRGQFLDTGWVVAKLSNLPVDGSELTLEYGLSGDSNEAHSSWAYFDNVNLPPVARFEFLPNQPVEGDYIRFTDLSYDPDPEDSIVSWQWIVNSAEIGEEVFNEKELTYIFPNEGTVSVSLTVTDSYGATNTISTGQTATDNTPVS